MMRRLLLIPIAAIALALSGCGVQGEAPMDMVSEGSLPEFSDDREFSEEMVTSAPAVTEEFSVDGAVDRSYVVTGSMYLTVDDPFVAATEVEDIVVAAGGRVDSRSESVDAEGENSSAYVWVRIPADLVDSTLAEIEQLGIVESQSRNNQDVTLQRIDLEARVGVLEDAISRLRELLDTASTTAEIIEIEAALGDRQAELDSLQGQLDYLGDQVDYASYGIDLRTPEAAPERQPDSFLEGIVAGWMGMLAFFAGSVVVAGMLVPWLAGVVVIVGAVWLVIRARRRRTAS